MTDPVYSQLHVLEGPGGLEFHNFVMQVVKFFATNLSALGNKNFMYCILIIFAIEL